MHSMLAKILEGYMHQYPHNLEKKYLRIFSTIMSTWGTDECDAVFQDRNWNYETFDFDANLALADSLDNGLTAMSPNLREFIARGGKLLHHEHLGHR